MINIERFISAYYMLRTRESEAGLRQLLGMFSTDGEIINLHQLAYMLATAKHETARTFKPIEETGKGAGQPYGTAVTVTVNGEQFTNVYYGRGYVQLTHLDNYRRVSARLGVGELLVSHPEQALNPLIAYKILTRGMMEGWFTGHPLTRFIDTEHVDFFNARRVVNKLDRAPVIAGYAEEFYKLLSLTWQSTEALPPLEASNDA